MASTAHAHARSIRRGVTSWLTTTNHKGIGILYIMTSLVFFLIAVTLRDADADPAIVPNNTFLGPERYNQIFTMHGTTMVFLFGMPVLPVWPTTWSR